MGSAERMPSRSGGEDGFGGTGGSFGSDGVADGTDGGGGSFGGDGMAASGGPGASEGAGQQWPTGAGNYTDAFGRSSGRYDGFGSALGGGGGFSPNVTDERTRQAVYAAAFTSLSGWGRCRDEGREPRAVLDAIFNAW